jgi:N6-adenosine-specific RNA methylase IME4
MLCTCRSCLLSLPGRAPVCALSKRRKMEEERKRYNLIYADPPWPYKSGYTGANRKAGAIHRYVLMTWEDLKAFPIGLLAADKAVLFLWATVPLLSQALPLMELWGFRYVTMLTWRKLGRLGMGSWFRLDCEHLLVGIRGRVKAFHMQKSNFYECRLGEHSQKPHYYRELIEECANRVFAKSEKLELFARSRPGLFPDYEYKGWDVYGNQVNGSIVLPEGPLNE